MVRVDLAGRELDQLRRGETQAVQGRQGADEAAEVCRRGRRHAAWCYGAVETQEGDDVHEVPLDFDVDVCLEAEGCEGGDVCFGEEGVVFCTAVAVTVAIAVAVFAITAISGVIVVVVVIVPAATARCLGVLCRPIGCCRCVLAPSRGSSRYRRRWGLRAPCRSADDACRARLARHTFVDIASVPLPSSVYLLIQVPESILGVLPVRDVEVVVQMLRQTGLAGALGPQDGDEQELLRTWLYGRPREYAPRAHQL